MNESEQDKQTQNGTHGGSYEQRPNSSYSQRPQQQGRPYTQQSPPPNGSYTQQPPPVYYVEPPVPSEVRRWNWGAFSLNWIWGCSNGAYLALLYFIPVFGWFVWPFVCGARGNIWAWKSGKFKDLDTFLTTQRTWNIAGIILFCIGLLQVLLVILIVAGAIMVPWTFFGGDTGYFGYNEWG
ncbi:MAG: hypothetical protein LBS67_03940 [Clostridiales Family XIII bacterium]|jgi:hypothetical protein|nr:hypothetical protein [Clostridiales Family XIII bacterium]